VVKAEVDKGHADLHLRLHASRLPVDVAQGSPPRTPTLT